MTVHRRPSRWSDWMAAVCAGVSSGEQFGIRLTVEERDALAALCIEYGGITRTELMTRLIMERAKTIDVQGNIAHFVHTGTAKPYGTVAAPRSPWQRLQPPPTLPPEPAPSAWHGPASAPTPSAPPATGYTSTAPATTLRDALPAPQQAPARPAAQPPPLPGRRS